MFKTMLLAVVAGVTFGVGGSLSFGSSNIEGLVSGLIAITCIAIPISLIVLVDKKRMAKL